MEADWISNPKGRELPPKPSSALAALRGIRRVHVKRLSIDSIQLRGAVEVTEGMLREYALMHGPEALLPQRKEPLTGVMICNMLELPTGTRLGPSTVIDWDRLEWASLRGVICLLAQSGFRKAEVSLPSGVEFGPMHLSLANLVWRIRAVEEDGGERLIIYPTVEQLRKLAPGDYALLRPPPSKADQLGLHWGADPIYLPWDPRQPMNAAVQLAALERLRKVHGPERRAVPLFVDGRNRPWHHGLLDMRLKQLLAAIGVSEAEAKRYSWHSFRIYLACALLAAGADAPTIQALLRWRSAEALKLYARMNAEVYAGWLSSASTADISSVRATMWRLPRTDVDDAVAALTRGIERFYVAADRADAGLPDEDDLDE